MLIKGTSRANVDFVGENITRLALMAKEMPPAYAGAGVREPVCAPGGGIMGHVLDGKGLYLDCDLKDLGITKKIPHVYERSLTQRILDKLGTEDGAITTYDGIIAARAAGNASDVMFTKVSYTSVANVWSSLYRAGGFPLAGTYTNIPTGAAKNRTDVGALSLGISNPGAGNSYLLTFGYVSASQINMGLLVDLLVAAGNISGTSAVAQTISSAALTRYTSGAGVYMTFEITTALGATASNITVSYTNQAGTAGQSTGAQAMLASGIVQRLTPVGAGPQIVMASGDYGVQAVATVTLSISMAAGVFALNLFKPLVFMPGLAANIYGERDSTTTIDGLIQLPVDAGPQIGCLTMYLLTNAVTSGILTGAIRTCWG